MNTTPLAFSSLVLQCLLVCCGIGMIPTAQAEDAIRLRTTLGDIFVTLTPEAAPQTATFAVFTQLTQSGSEVAFDPAVNRAFVRFRNLAGELRGSTSVALRTVPAG